ncbi:unnamed protein product [Mytilus coruscus]|uniref:C2H2-type domain-containing protein n=1 Tax=Mytilus coruscus TaxID=42192 RepID=A0A6J8EN12_MYTCO|nr:unnamed protein product [Mytilus coruscus]
MFALSDSEKCFSQSCNTQDKHSCEQCIDLADFLAEISTLTQNGTWDNNDSIVFQISQDGSVTASVLCDVVHDLTKQVPNIQEVNFFSDNAGCYKKTIMMVALRAELGDKLKTYNFSEALDGKGPCDSRASHIKACVRRYINEGHDVTSAEEMEQAIDVKQKGSFRVRFVDIVTNLDAEKSQIKPITGITQLHNFSFDVNGITVWKAYGIGEGKRISWDNIGTSEQRTNLLVKVDWTIAAPQLLEEEVMAQEEELIEPNPKTQKKNSINQPYDCPKDGCTRAFKTQCALEQHIIVGNCDYHNEKTTQDKAKSMYGQKVNSLFHGTRVQLDCNFNDCRTSESVKGWALKGPRDAAGGIIKRQADCAILRRQTQIRTAKDLYEYANSFLTQPRSHCKRRIFRYAETIHRDNRLSFKPVPSIRSLHQVRASRDSAKGLINISELSCFCVNCCHHMYDQCSNSIKTGGYTEWEMKREYRADAQENEENEQVSVQELVSVGQLVTLYTDDDEEESYMLKAEKSMETLRIDTTDSWKSLLPAGTPVFREFAFLKLFGYKRKSPVDTDTEAVDLAPKAKFRDVLQNYMYTAVDCESYGKIESWQIKREISVLSKTLTYEGMSQKIPGIAVYRYYIANKHSTVNGCALSPPTSEHHSPKMDPHKLDLFLDFITSTHIIKDLMKLSNGKFIENPM